jgi:hypothetical protein
MALRHELPTHLAVEDRILAGLTMRQLMLLLGGLPGAYAGWLHSQALPLALRLTLTACGLALTLATALWRPGAHDLPTWALLLLRYLALPKRCVWRPAPSVAPSPVTDVLWQAVQPELTWGANAPPERTVQP